MNKKIGIIISIIFLGICIVLLIIYEKNVKEKKPDPSGNEIENRLIIDNTSYWSYDQSWEKSNFSDKSSEKFNVYIDNRFLGSYKLEYGQKWNIFDNDDNFVNYNGSILAYNNSFDVEVIKFSIDQVTDIELKEASSILKSNIATDDLSLNERVRIDLDNNGIIDEIVNISNLDSLNQTKYFNLIYIVFNGKVEVLINESVDEKDLLIYPIYNIKYILNIEDNNRSIIIQKGYFSEAGNTGNMLFQYIDNKYTKVIED